MPIISDDPTLPVACAIPSAPDLPSLQCEPELNYGPIANLYIGTNDPTAAATGATLTAVEITARLLLPLTDVKALRLLICTMTFGSPNTATEEFNGVNYPKPGVRSFPVETKDTSAANFEFARSTQKGGRSVRVWGVSAGGKFLYGGANGISGILTLNNELGAGFTDANTIKGALSLKSFFDPKRSPSPVPAV